MPWSSCSNASGPRCVSHIAPASSPRGTPTCASSGCGTPVGPTAFSMPSDPRRPAILLIGGDKTGDDRWYTTYVPLADRLYDAHLAQLRQEGERTNGEEH